MSTSPYSFFNPQNGNFLARPSYNPTQDVFDELLEFDKAVSEFEKATQKLKDLPSNPRLDKLKPSHDTNLNVAEEVRKKSSQLITETEKTKEVKPDKQGPASTG